MLEDIDVREEDFKLATPANILTAGIYKQFNLLPHIAETKVEQYWKQS